MPLARLTQALAASAQPKSLDMQLNDSGDDGGGDLKDQLAVSAWPLQRLLCDFWFPVQAAPPRAWATPLQRTAWCLGLCAEHAVTTLLMLLC